VGGLLASGKSTVARLIADRISADVLSADEIRGDLFEEGAADAFVPVVLDGTFRSRGTREAARRLAIDHGVPFLFVECRADPETCRARLRRRERERGQPGWVAMLEAFLELWEPVDELREDEHVVLDTTGPPEALEGRGLDLAERALERER
jgi:predicted kinase